MGGSQASTDGTSKVWQQSGPASRQQPADFSGEGQLWQSQTEAHKWYAMELSSLFFIIVTTVLPRYHANTAKAIGGTEKESLS